MQERLDNLQHRLEDIQAQVNKKLPELPPRHKKSQNPLFEWVQSTVPNPQTRKLYLEAAGSPEALMKRFLALKKAKTFAQFLSLEAAVGPSVAQSSQE